jgi:hypothetical protein
MLACQTVVSEMLPSGRGEHSVTSVTNEKYENRRHFHRYQSEKVYYSAISIHIFR